MRQMAEGVRPKQSQSCLENVDEGLDHHHIYCDAEWQDQGVASNGVDILWVNELFRGVSYVLLSCVYSSYFPIEEIRHRLIMALNTV